MMIENIFKYIRRNRELFLQLINRLSIEQLNKIPEGFNNNIAWNFGHIIASTQSLCYVRSEVKPDLDIRFRTKYQKGSKPGRFYSTGRSKCIKAAFDLYDQFN